jgi:hypothetical protein
MFRPQRGIWRIVRLAGTALIVVPIRVAWGQQAATLNGPPVQLQPYVSEPGVPMVTVTLGTPNPFGGGTDGTDGTDPTDGAGSGGLGSGSSGGSSDALNTMLGTPWGAQAAADAQALGVNASALAATCVVESGCGANVGSGSGAQGVFQMFPTAFQEGISTALAANHELASQIVQGAAGMNDPVTEAIAASGYLMQANQALENAGLSNPTVLDARAYYNFGPQGGINVATASASELMADALPMYTAPQLAANGVTPGMTVGQWQASVASKIGNAAGQSVVS